VPVIRRDPFFERLVRDEIASIEIYGTYFEGVDVIQLDAVAYDEIRRERLSEVHQQLLNDLSQESFRRLQKLAVTIPKHGVVPFVGAGMSASSGYPSWSKFLCDLALGWLDEGAVRARISLGDLEGLAEDIQSVRGAGSFEESLDVFDQRYLPTEEAYLLFDLFEGAIVTSNFDGLLESAASRIGRSYKPIEGCGQWSGWTAEGNAGNEQVILKLHGHHKRSLHRVLLRDQYDAAYGTGGPVRRDLRDLLATNCLLFLGCSLENDRTMDIALQVQAERGPSSTRRHYAILAETPDRQQRETFLADRGIFPIWYPNDSGDHSMVGLLLWWLKDAIASSNTSAP
jgi:hypothetical protein